MTRMRHLVVVVVVVVVAVAVVVAGLARAAEGGHERTGGSRLSGGMTVHTVTHGESLSHIGSMFGIDPATLAADNHLDPGAPLAIGQVLRIDNRHIVPDATAVSGLVVNIPQRMLFFTAEGAVGAFPVAVGSPSWQTPTAAFRVITKQADPVWHVPSSILRESARAGRSQPRLVPPGPTNPLGGFWIGLSLSGIGIHGPTAPASIYHAVTHGCIRVGAEHMRTLFPLVTVGTAGQLIYEPVLLAQVDDRVYLEVHRDVYRRLTVEPLEIVRIRAGALGARIDWTVARAVIAAREGIAREVTIGSGD